MKRVIGIGFTALALLGSTGAAEFSETEIAGKPITVCRVDVQKEPLQLFLRDDAGQPIKRFERLAKSLDSKGKKLVFAMNAGMFHGDFLPWAFSLPTASNSRRSTSPTAKEISSSSPTEFF